MALLDYQDHNQDPNDEYARRMPGETVSQPPAPPRWSRALENMPTWLQGQSSDVQTRAKSFYDTHDDPNAEIQRQLAQVRSQAASRGMRVADDDLSLLPSLFSGGDALESISRFTNTAPLFDDPASRLVEDSALARYQHLQNPDANSGTALFEQYARELANTLRQPVYSAQDESIIKGKALSTISSEADQTKQRWLEEMNRRGIPPSSGIALEGLQRIDQHFGGLRTQVESEFARGAIDQTRQQRFQALDTLARLSGAEESRLREANTYAGIPLQLQDNAFQRNLQLMGASGSPQSMLQSLMGIQQLAQNAQQMDSQSRAAMTQGLMQYLGYLMGGQ